MAEAITQPCNKWCSSMVWSKRVDRTCTYTYTYESSATSESDPARAEYIRFTVDQYDLSGKRKLKSIKQDLALTAGSFSFDLVDECRSFYLTMQLRNSCGASGNLSWNEQNIGTPPLITRENLNLEYDATVAGGNLKYGFTGINNTNQDYRNDPRSDYKVTLIRKQFINGAATSDWSAVTTNTLKWDSNEEVNWSKTATFTKPTKDTDWVHFILYVEPLTIFKPLNWNTSKDYYIAMPPKPAITGFSKSTNGEGAMVSVKYNQMYDRNIGTPQKPMDKLTLQKQYAKSADAIVATGWEDFDNSQTVEPCSGDVTAGFYVADKDITPDKNQHVFLRAKAEWQNLTPNYSEAYMVPDEYYYRQAFTYEDSAPETGTDGITISEVSTGDDNQSLVVVIGYDNISTYDGCELGYSTDKDAWWSTKQPETIEMPDDDWKRSDKLAPKNTYCSKIKVADLEEETTYYLRARRYKSDNDTKKTKWSVEKQGNTGGEELTGLVLTVGDRIATNKPCTFTWNFPDGLKQTEWFLKDATSGDCLVKGTGTVTTTSYAFSSAGEKNVIITSFFSNGKSMDSNIGKISVVNPPTVSFSSTPAATVTTLPYKFTVKANMTDANVQVVVKSKGIQSRSPEGKLEQCTGDVVYSNSGTGSVTCSINNDNVNRLWNGGVYTIYATATANGVTSTELTRDFTVNYSTRVTIPAAKNVIITPTTDKGATIQVKSLASGTTWDLYRATNDMRNALIASDLATGATVTDRFAPFNAGGNCQYIVQVRNSKRQFDYAGYSYTANYGMLRFDWDNTYVELPYNIEISDETDKQFEQQIYLDGTQRGAWGASVVRSATLSTDTIYIKDEETQKKIRDLARYQGAVFVRTPLGQAYTANVEVRDINKTYDKKAMAVSFNCTEIDLTSDYMAEKPV